MLWFLNSGTAGFQTLVHLEIHTPEKIKSTSEITKEWTSHTSVIQIQDLNTLFKCVNCSIY